jgi:hypothetical protein
MHIKQWVSKSKNLCKCANFMVRNIIQHPYILWAVKEKLKAWDTCQVAFLHYWACPKVAYFPSNRDINVTTIIIAN